MAADITFLEEPKITLVGHTKFLPKEFPYNFPSQQDMLAGEDITDGAIMAESAGRVCYMSYEKGRPHDAYLKNILESMHGSTLEHTSFNFLIEGVSRSLTHELIRHRAGTGYSQQSQRYIDASDVAFVIPPKLLHATGDLKKNLMQVFKASCATSLAAYNAMSQILAEDLKSDKSLSGHERRKMARETARSVLPNAAETKLVFTVNARAMRHIMSLRGSPHAEPEIRRLMHHFLEIVQPLAKPLFDDFRTEEAPILDAVVCDYPKP